ncbi:MAG: DUF3368 domain-containing protein [Candidatus Vecturithrix sp.]|jgi:predicted nucleic acid-binding protein|nr:DUF3368 domain-containing protein [Candidatus Vecturithrix sp.]
MKSKLSLLEQLCRDYFLSLRAPQPAMILVDDLKARKLAKMKGPDMIGTLGIVLEDKREGLIIELKPLIEELISNDIRISAKIIEMILQAAQE